MATRRFAAKNGRRPDLGDKFFRSSWEANYARYLNHLIDIEEIVRWEYEPRHFQFPVKRGNKSYLPDFKVWTTLTDYEWHEVKGYMDSASVIKLRRFKLHFPEEYARFKLIDKSVYYVIKELYSAGLDGWE